MHGNASLTRREFVKLAAATTIAVGAGSITSAAASKDGVPYRPLGRTGERVSAIGLGGYHIGKQADEQESIRLIRGAIDGGITFMDNCWDYHGGASEIRMGKALRDGYRERVFLMSKIDGRHGICRLTDRGMPATATNRSHRPDAIPRNHSDGRSRSDFCGERSDGSRAGRPAGRQNSLHRVYRAQRSPRPFTNARDRGQPRGALRCCPDALERHGRTLSCSFEHQVLPLLLREEIAVLGMKAFGDPFILRSNTVTPIECLQYVLNLPISTVITGIDSVQVLEQDLEAARTFVPLSKEAVANLLARTADAAATGKYELFKTSNRYDGTAQNPHWLG
jgi:uncharacterized protein